MKTLSKRSIFNLGRPKPVYNTYQKINIHLQDLSFLFFGAFRLEFFVNRFDLIFWIFF